MGGSLMGPSAAATALQPATGAPPGVAPAASQPMPPPRYTPNYFAQHAPPPPAAAAPPPPQAAPPQAAPPTGDGGMGGGFFNQLPANALRPGPGGLAGGADRYKQFLQAQMLRRH
jgi:hypothetical protein